MKRIEFEDALIVEPAKVSVLDEMPVGTVVDFDGTEIPVGWEEVEATDDYSTEETFTGKYWIDGKKIYRKVLRDTTLETPSVTFYINLPNETIINVHGYIQFSNTGKVFIPYYSKENDNCSVWTGSNNIGVATTHISKPITIIVEYTKTTE